MKTLQDLFFNELSDIYDAERRIAKALPKMVKAATSEPLKKAFELHLKQTEVHAQKVVEVFACFDRKARAKTCEATVGLLKEGEEIAAEFKGFPAINAALRRRSRVGPPGSWGGSSGKCFASTARNSEIKSQC
jgi:ferritin-like metal-binding protein YciE